MNEATPKRYPKAEIQVMASEFILQHGGPDVCQVFIKSTCPHCGGDCAFAEPNIIYDEMECCHCGVTFTPTLFGFMALMKLGNDHAI